MDCHLTNYLRATHYTFIIIIITITVVIKVTYTDHPMGSYFFLILKLHHRNDPKKKKTLSRSSYPRLVLLDIICSRFNRFYWSRYSICFDLLKHWNLYYLYIMAASNIKPSTCVLMHALRHMRQCKHCTSHPWGSAPKTESIIEDYIEQQSPKKKTEGSLKPKQLANTGGKDDMHNKKISWITYTLYSDKQQKATATDSFSLEEYVWLSVT